MHFIFVLSRNFKYPRSFFRFRLIYNSYLSISMSYFIEYIFPYFSSFCNCGIANCGIPWMCIVLYFFLYFVTVVFRIQALVDRFKVVAYVVVSTPTTHTPE